MTAYGTSFINDLSPLCALALVVTVAPRYVICLRDFLNRYIANRVFFGLSLVCMLLSSLFRCNSAIATSRDPGRHLCVRIPYPIFCAEKALAKYSSQLRPAANWKLCIQQ